MWKTSLVGLVCLVLSVECVAQAPLTLGEMASWKIVCSPAANACESYAASEFQNLLKELTGLDLPIVETVPGNAPAILIGPEAVTAYGGRANTDELGEEGFHLDVSPTKVEIFGGRPRGTLYGVYEFFEELCGVRYLTHDHTFYPRNGKDIKIDSRRYTHVPPFAFRWSYYGETNRNSTFAARLHINTVGGEEKLGGTTGFKLVGHNVAYLASPATYGKAHPEYYALVNGRRTLEMHGGGPQLCMTNPDVLEIVIQATLDAIEKNPSVKNFNVAHMDNVSYCTCANCAAIDAREESHAGATLSFVNAVAERIERTHPDVLIGTYAYQYTRKPPKTIRARDNVLIQLCSIECCNFHAIDDPGCSLNQEFCDDMAGWKEKAKNIFIWHYNTNFKGYLLPYPNLRSIGRSVDYYANNNGKGVFMQAAGNGFSTELSDLRNYVMSRCLWKPGRDSWQETLEFCRLHYAEAAPPIIGYLTYYHDLIKDQGRHPTCFPTEVSLCINPVTARRIEAYWAQALTLARTEDVRARVEKASLCALRALLSAASMDLKYEEGLCKPYLEGGNADLLERYAKLCAKYNVSMENERTTAQTYIDTMRKLYAGMRAVRLENDIWRVLVLADSNAKIVEMTYKPTGRDVIQPTRALDRFRFEEWVRQGAGPQADNILPYEVVEESPTRAVVAITAADGARIERTITLQGDAIRFETVMKAKEARAFEFLVHPEYDSGSGSDDPREIGLYVKAYAWVQANRGWVDAKPTDAQKALVREGLQGGALAYYNRKAAFGVEQRFDPEAFEELSFYWSPERIQINLEMTPVIQHLEAGQEASYAYEVRYLKEAPQ
jgi:Domain of unknown function (DUF4838)/Glycosyl hydrolase family 67 N-terminus